MHCLSLERVQVWGVCPATEGIITIGGTDEGQCACQEGLWRDNLLSDRYAPCVVCNTGDVKDRVRHPLARHSVPNTPLMFAPSGTREWLRLVPTLTRLPSYMHAGTRPVCPTSHAVDYYRMRCRVFAHQVSNEPCLACSSLHERRFGLTDPYRRETRGGLQTDHDSLADCGCVAGYYMNFSSLTPALVTARCPVSSRIDLWAAHANLSRYAAGCCAGGPCNSRSQWLCVERVCRDEYLAELLAVEDDGHEPGRCVLCPPHQLTCNESFLSTRSVSIRPGYWRTNELSTDLRECFPRAVCVGDERADASRRRTESLCLAHHWGPYCSLCVEVSKCMCMQFV